MKEPGEKNDGENDNIFLKWQNVPTKSAKRVNEESPKLHIKKKSRLIYIRIDSTYSVMMTIKWKLATIII